MGKQRVVPPSSPSTGYEAFRAIWSNFGGLSAAALGGGATVPFVAFLAKIAPPWPPGIVLTTALAEFITLITVFQFLHKASGKTVRRVLGIAAAVLFVLTFVYLFLFATLTYQTPTTGEQWVQGFVCTPMATRLYAQQCPLLGSLALREAGYEAELLWERWSIVTAGLVIDFIWISFFITVSILIGTFLIYQTKRTAPKT